MPATMHNDAQWSVHDLVQAIKQTIEQVPSWQHLSVIGELSNLKRHGSGHWYFILRDREAQLRAVMFRRDAERCAFTPEDGMAVLCQGRIGVFERDGQTQLYVSAMQPLGAGDAHARLERLKQKLYAEGLFSRPKRKIPLLPRALGLITSPTGAARHDVETVVQRRFPAMPIVLYPVLVQGDRAVDSIVSALANIDPTQVDLIILGRGGGSKEDLMVFNEERVVRAVAAVGVPVISAVGHEIDTTLTDLVADLRAATPSAAAELAVPERSRLQAEQTMLTERAQRALLRRIQTERQRLNGWVGHGILTDPRPIIDRRRGELDRLDERIERWLERSLGEHRHRLERLAASLRSLNPEAVLERGYTYVADEYGAPRNYEDIRPDQSYWVHWYNGKRRMIEVEDAD